MAPNAALVSGVRHCIGPRAVLEELMGKAFPYIIIDRTPFIAAPYDRITVSMSAIDLSRHFPAGNPADSDFELFQDRYEVIAGFDSNDGRASANGLEFTFSGMILRKF